MTSLGATIAALSQKPGTSRTRDSRLKLVNGFGDNPGNLEMKVHSPRQQEANAPLVVVLHGCTQTADDYAAAVGWLDLADRFGFVVVTPEQQRSNNSNLCFNWYDRTDAERGRGEAASIAQMVIYAVQTFGLDARRVYITGLSAGGAMTSVMLATYPELFAGGAVIAGIPFGIASSLPQALEAMAMSSAPSARQLGQSVRRATDFTGRWPTVTVWHGQSDRIVQPQAGEAVARQWCHVHGVTATERTARTPDGRNFLVWLSPDGQPVVELHRIGGLGHGAAVRTDGMYSCGYGSPYTPDVGISSSFEIALGWGLVHRHAEPSRETRPPACAPEKVFLAESSQRTPPDRVTDVINGALRVAGLLR